MLALMRRPRRPHGFTLIELMVTLAIAAILMFLAVPSFVSFQKNAQLTSAANSLLAAINAARGEAMKRGMSAMVVPTNNGSDWKTGWVVFVDKDNSRTYTDTGDNTVLTQASLPSGVSIIGNNTAAGSKPYIMFDASGYSKTKTGGFGALSISFARTDVGTADQYRQTRRLIIASTGRVRMCTPVSATDTNCTATVSQTTGQ
jgi:type IV fimbrial biogenesis protein FimT